MSNGVLIVGLGNIGMQYDMSLNPSRYVFSHARAFSQHPEFHLVAGVDPDERQRQLYSQTYQLPAYANIEAAIENHSASVVVIATPTKYHRATLEDILRLSRPKVVLCEKPLSYDVDDARKMVAVCAESGALLYVNYIRRSDSAAIEIKQWIDSGKIEKPIKGVAWYSKGLLHNGSHFFNLLEYWLGAMRSSTILNPGRLWGQVDPEPDIHIEFANGSVVFLAAWEEAFSHYGIELLSPSGRLRYDCGGSTVQWQAAKAIPNGDKQLSSTPIELINGMDKYQWHVADQIANAIREKSFNLCSGETALGTLISIHSLLAGREQK